ncbi:MAG: sugar phosphate isomerase/epimerase [Verrucomicrobiota bacterium]
METRFFLSCWANELSLKRAIEEAVGRGYHGVEGPLPREARKREEALELLVQSKLPFIAEVVTGGGYVPDLKASVEEHLDDLDRGLNDLTGWSPIRVNVLGGSDQWNLNKAVDFITSGMALVEKYGHPVSWETHRSRPTFHPGPTLELLAEIPEMRLTVDFSHWCVVCERAELGQDVLEAVAERARHIHARIGHEQGPQVHDPEDRRYADTRQVHLDWWTFLRGRAAGRGASLFTVTPEFGPDGYGPVSLSRGRQTGPGLRETNEWVVKFLSSAWEL